MKFAICLLFALILEPAFAGDKEARLRRHAQELQKESMIRDSLRQFVNKNRVQIFNWRHSRQKFRPVATARIGEGRMPNGDMCRIKLELRQGKYGGLRTERISIVSGVCSPKNGAEPYSLYSVMLKQNLIEEQPIASVRFYAIYQQRASAREIYAQTVRIPKYGSRAKLQIADGDRGEITKHALEKSKANFVSTGTRR